MEAAQRGMSGMQASGRSSPAATCLHTSLFRSCCFATKLSSKVTGVRCSAGTYRLPRDTQQLQGEIGVVLVDPVLNAIVVPFAPCLNKA